MRENLAEAIQTNQAATEICSSILNSCKDAKGQDLKLLSISEISDVADYFVIVSGRSDRQVQGIANRILEDLAIRGIKPFSLEGLEKGHWVLMDFGDIVVHVFYEPQREYYDLEGLWAKAPRVAL
ncbi:MAG: ribosome silencing factor [Proteobacteria bacterium]|nr:MAG: ribosome silencing factor [Pseudomonadota bacterium]